MLSVLSGIVVLFTVCQPPKIILSVYELVQVARRTERAKKRMNVVLFTVCQPPKINLTVYELVQVFRRTLKVR